MSAFRIVEHKIPCQYIREYPRALANRQEDTLHLAVKQYIPIDNPNPQPGDVTIIGAHANAFPKELYEPLWEDLLSRAKTCGWRIRSIWIADVAQQGASSVLNENILGNDPNWLDHPRDLLHMINMKRDEMPRPLIGVGHSMGGCQLVNLSLIHPRLFTTLVLIDPVIEVVSEKPDNKPPHSYAVAALSTFRRSLWPSRQVAGESFLSAPFYKAWDRRVVERWIEHGLREAPTNMHPEAKSPQVTLTTPPSHEVHTFLRPNYEASGVNGNPLDQQAHPDLNPNHPRIAPFYRSESSATAVRLPEVRPSVLYIFGGLSNVGNPAANTEKVKLTGSGVGGSGGEQEGKVKGVTFEDIGHMIPMEVVERTADHLAEWVGPQIVQWREDQKQYEEWTKKTLSAKQGITEEWKKHMGGPPVKKSKQSKI